MAENETPETEASSDTPQEPEEAVQAQASGPDQGPASDESATPAEAQEQTPAAAAPKPAEVLPPKERKQRARAAKGGSRRASSPEERLAQRTRKRELRRQGRARLRDKRRRERTGEGGKPAAAAQGAPRQRGAGKQKTRQGVVVSDRAAKTITVRIDTAHRHSRYEKIVRTSRTVHAHDEGGEAHVGDTVVVRECRPLSRTKRWRLERILERAG
ncbi:MAG: 30S ribosomal protein S17 [Solirubrobacterales bacterium]|nr:30S ribosomal protein S17 [Solirubrobacterales bacterium]MBV8940818.1 30S ribosomal protein S17 [Solirubrobacterales bacterium]MBV9166896.1 30S ribosomal protein S17 [Solirubrobacterales bacterium]